MFCGSFFIVVVSIFVKYLYCGGASWSISRLAPAPQRSNTVVYSLCVLVAKHDLVTRCIHRLDQSRILPACKSLLHWRTCSAGCGLSRCSVVAAQSTLFRKKLGKNLLGRLRCKVNSRIYHIHTDNYGITVLQ